MIFAYKVWTCLPGNTWEYLGILVKFWEEQHLWSQSRMWWIILPVIFFSLARVHACFQYWSQGKLENCICTGTYIIFLCFFFFFFYVFSVCFPIDLMSILLKAILLDMHVVSHFGTVNRISRWFTLKRATCHFMQSVRLTHESMLLAQLQVSYIR